MLPSHATKLPGQLIHHVCLRRVGHGDIMQYVHYVLRLAGGHMFGLEAL